MIGLDFKTNVEILKTMVQGRKAPELHSQKSELLSGKEEYSYRLIISFWLYDRHFIQLSYLTLK